MNTSFNSFFKIYLILIFAFSSYYLFEKHLNLVEYTISDWLINYQGGFTRRGLLGEIVFKINSLFPIGLRKVIYILQLVFYSFYLILVFFFLKDLKKNYFTILAIFSPIFILYPLAEVEVLARKELFLFITFLLFINVCSLKKNENIKYYFLSIALPLIALIWEGVIFYITFFIFLVILSNKKNKLINLKIFLSFLPFLITLFFIFFLKLSPAGMASMCISVNECYGAMNYTTKTLLSYYNEVTSQFELIYFIRYILVFALGFLPFFFLCYHSRFTKIMHKNYLFKNNSPILIFIIILTPSLFLYFIAIDWGRWTNIGYTFSILSYFFCIKNNYIQIDNNKVNEILKKYFRKKIILIIIFVIFAFGWNPKTHMKEDIGSIPGYRILYKTYSKLAF